MDNVGQFLVYSGLGDHFIYLKMIFTELIESRGLHRVIFCTTNKRLYHSITKSKVTDSIFKFTLIHALVI